MSRNDWAQVRSIYLDGIATGHATFEAEAPEWEEWDSTHLPGPRLVARSGADVLGWAALTAVAGRCVYAGVTEVSLYVGQRYRRHGVGAALLGALVRGSEEAGVWTLQAGIFPENEASIALHRKHGFREVGRREKIGKMSYGALEGVWRDVILLERRSLIVGVE
jgi:phosphinothricin acetyltransferase